MNLSKCSKCGLSIIQEEIILHKCRDVIDYKFENDTVWLFDGELWYPRKLRTVRPPKNQHPFKTPNDSTEPKIIEKPVLN